STRAGGDRSSSSPRSRRCGACATRRSAPGPASPSRWTAAWMPPGPRRSRSRERKYSSRARRFMVPEIRPGRSGGCVRPPRLPSGYDGLSETTSRRLAAILGTLLALGVPGCASGPKKPDPVTQELLTQPKEVLFEKGKALVEKKKYDQGRKYLNHV